MDVFSAPEPVDIVLRPSAYGNPDDVAVPKESAQLPARLRLGDDATEKSVVVDGPGRYVVDAGGLRPATSADAPLFGTAQ